VGGEHILTLDTYSCRVGSSPRGRGTRVGSLRQRSDDRFIPAWAGNTRNTPDPRIAGLLPAVHPRVGGEHGSQPIVERVQPGSSPRGRGTQKIKCPHGLPPRFIPAWAGNTSHQKALHEQDTVHPRVGGEHGLE